MASKAGIEIPARMSSPSNLGVRVTGSEKRASVSESPSLMRPATPPTASGVPLGVGVAGGEVGVAGPGDAVGLGEGDGEALGLGVGEGEVVGDGVGEGEGLGDGDALGVGVASAVTVTHCENSDVLSSGSVADAVTT